MTESGAEFAGVSERSTKHNPRLDEELEHEMQGMLKAERSTRAAEWREVEPSAEGTVERKITSDTEAAGRTVRAGEDDPQYEVRSGKSGGTAVHKPGALRED